MWSIVVTEFQKVKRYQILLIGIIGLMLCPILQLASQRVAIEEVKVPNYDFTALLDSTIWGNATIFMPIIFTLIGGYLMNREYTDDTLKSVLVVPISFQKLIAGKLLAVGLLAILFGFYSFFTTILVGIAAGLPGFRISVLGRGLLQTVGIALFTYIAVLPIVTIAGKKPGGYMAGSVAAFILGYSSMFFKSGLLRSVYPFLAAFTVIGFDTVSFTNATETGNFILGILSLSTMSIISLAIICFSRAPEAVQSIHKKSYTSLLKR